MLIMNRKAFSGIIVLTMLLTCMLTLAFNIQPVKAGTIIVPDDYPTIQEAIDAASPRDTIFVKAGTYYEHLSINKSISLIGEDRNLTVIDGSGTGNVVTVTASNVIINNFTIQRSGSGGWSAGIRVNSIGNCNITRNKIENNNFGIYLYESSNNTISENDITANFCGVRLYLSSHNTLSKNNVTAITANDFYGIYLDRSSNNTLIGNTITKNSEVGIWLDYSSYNVLTGNQMSDNGKNFAVDGGYINYVDDSNTVNGKPIYYCISKKDKAIPFDAGCVILVYCEGIKVQNLMLTGNTRGIQLIYTKNSTITKNNITSCHDGISLDRSSNYNNITENNIISNRNGLFISYLSKYNVISKNRITGNHKGIIFSESSDNKIYHNNFIDNAEQAYSYASPNIWDDGYPSGGNYWSDYAGVDVKSGPNQDQPSSDGIGDTAYVIDADNQDNYPLMEPWGVVSGNLQILKPANGAVIVGPVNITFTIENTGRNIEFAKGDSANRIDLEIEYALNQTHGWGIKFWSTSDHGLNLSSGEKYRQTIVYDPSEYEEAVPPDFIEDAPYGEVTIRLVHWKQIEGSYSYGEFGMTEITVTLQRNDTAPPTMTLLSPENKTYTTTSIPLTFTPNETTSWIGYSLDNQANVTITGNTTLTGLSEGTHSITVYANDTSGNMGASEIVYFTVSLPYGPTAEFAVTPETADVGEFVKFDASASLLGWNGTHGLPITEYHWDFADGNKTTTSTPILYYSFISPGIYYVTLTVYAPGATPEMDSTTHKVTVISAPVGGYSVPIKGYTTKKPLTLYLALIGILTASFTIAKRRKKQQS